jgi:hypothetical protein
MTYTHPKEFQENLYRPCRAFENITRIYSSFDDFPSESMPFERLYDELMRAFFALVFLYSLVQITIYTVFP